MTNDNAHNDSDKTVNSIDDQIAERAAHAARYLRILHPPGSVFELRALGVGGSQQTQVGFFDDADLAAQEAVRLDILHEPRGVYVTLNPVQPELLSRCKNRLAKAKRGETTADQHVLKRRWLYIDVDPERAGGVSGIPATDDERDAARQRAEEVCAWLTQEFDWPEPIRVESGNGAFLLYPIDLPNDPESTALIKAILSSVASRWTDKRVKIDRSVFNAGRICRLLATKNRKGDSTEQRPHRFCQKLRVPEGLANGWARAIPEDRLRLVAALAPANEASNKKCASQSLINASPTDNHPGNGSHQLNVENWLTDRGIKFQPAKTLADGRTCWPIVCPFNPDHGFDANITQDADGTLGASCFHDGCAGNHWQEFKERIGPPDADHYDTPLPADDRPPIVIDPDEHQVIDATVAALRAVASLYQRHGVLVRITRPDNIPDGAIQSVAPPSIEVVPPATLRELITRCARLFEIRDDALKPVHPKAWQVNGVSCRGAWDGIPTLTGIAQTPLMRADGSILMEPGYDAATGIFLELGDLVVTVPHEPTRDQAVAAARELLDVFCDFPLEAEHHRSALLALILTPFARPAFAGPTPLFLFDANVRGSGKTLAADIVGLITTGEDLARMSNPNDDNEARKRITALALRGVTLCLIDNIVGTLGSAALDAALTATRWQDRILGHTRIVDLPMSIVWLATGNNVILAADTSRRVCPIRLDCKVEKPEDRTDFRHPDLRQHVRANRGRLVSAALTILRAYYVAGRPQTDLPGWGSYEGWTALIRQAVVWLGLPDPAAGRIDMIERADVQASALRMLIESWPEIDPDGAGLTTGQLLRKLSEQPSQFARVREAILELCGGSPEKLPTVRQVGNKLRHLKGRIVGMLCLDSHPDRTGAQVWRVVKAGASSPDADSAESADSARSPN